MSDLYRPHNTDEPAAKSGSTVQWLTALLLLHLASLVLSWIAYIPIPTGWISWIQRACSVGAILCLFLLTPANFRYRKAAFFRTAVFCCSMLSLIIPQPTVDLILFLLGIVLPLFACWHEFRSHGELAASASPRLPQGWRWLFAGTLILVIFSCAVTVVYTLLPTGVPVAAATVISSVTLVLEDILELIYLLLLLFTIRRVQ